MSRARQLADSADLSFDDGTLVVDSANNRVGIGEASPTQLLHVNGNTRVTGLFYAADGTGASPSIRFFNASTGMYHPGSDALGFVASGSERMRIDSSGNLLVGKTAISGTTVGFEARADGLVQTVRDSGLAMRLYRQTLDGDIVEFRKDNTPVGSIGTKGSDLYLGTGVVGLRFEDSSNSIVAIDTTTQGSTDADVDLGKSNVRFKDLYLSGGVTFDAGSNFLDDYEYGLHTPVLTNATTNLTYTIPQDKTYYVKIGRLIEVHYDFDINVTNVGSGQLQMSLPFTCQSSPQSFQTNYGMRASSFFPSLFGYEVTGFPSSNNYFFQKTTGAGGVEATLDHTDYTTGNKRISFIISYLTTA